MLQPEVLIRTIHIHTALLILYLILYIVYIISSHGNTFFVAILKVKQQINFHITTQDTDIKN